MQSDNWRQLADRYNTSIEDIKERLPLEWVVSVAAGINLVRSGEGRSHGLCPFHPDENPSFDVYGYGERWGCYPCGDGGDLFDFIGKYWELQSFGARIEKSLDLLEAFGSEDGKWAGIIERDGPLVPVTVAELSGEVQAAYDVMAQQTTKPLRDLLERKGITQIDLDWLKRTWRVGVTAAGEVMAPYWDRDGKLVTHKTRFPGRGGWYARKGVSITSMYGEHQLTGASAQADVWICEGETDTWLASWLLRGRGIALGVSGAGMNIRDEWVEMMRERRVVLVFDADKAGRTAAERWWRQLHTVAREVVITFPQSDLCESKDPERVLHSGRVVTSLPGFMTEDPGRKAYRTIQQTGPGEVLSNWVFDANKVIEHRDSLGAVVGEGFEGSFADQAGTVRIGSKDFLTASALREWSTRNRRSWYGAAAKHPQNLLAMLQSQAPFLKKEIAVPVSGLWGVEEGNSVFVLPEGSGGSIGSAIGRERWSFGEGAKFEIGSRYRLEDREGLDAMWARESIKALLMLHRPAVTTPLLAWMMAAPLRSLVREFPPLAVLGGSGTGKTTLTLLVMKLLWGWQGAEQNLTNTTPYAVKQASASTNGLPIWWDEYRHHTSRKETFEAIGQVLRDSWTGSVSSRGGVGDDLSRIEVTASLAPLVLSGEAGLEERSHQDRVIVINLGFSGKNVDAMERVSGIVEAGAGGVLGRRLIEWELAKLDAGDTLVSRGMPGKPDRQAQGVAVLEWGWEMLRVWLREELDVELDWELDLSGVYAERSGVDEFPEMSALLEALQEGVRERSDSFSPVAWVEDWDADVVAVKQRAFFKWASNAGYVLPGRERGTMDVLRKRFSSLGNMAHYQAFGERRSVRAERLMGIVSYARSIGVEIPNRAAWDQSD